MKQYLNIQHHRINNYSLKHYFFSLYKKVETIIFIILSLIFLILSKTNRDFTNKISYFFVDISLPVVNAAALPFNLTINLITNFEELVLAKKENEILRKENENLKNSVIKTLNIANENKELKEILKFAIPKSLNYKTAQVLGKTHQSFNHQLFLESREDVTLKNGSAVINNKSMIGRIVDSTGNRARLLLLTDSNSRIPIIVSEARARGVLVGTNSNLMEINFLPKDHNIQIEDMVFTSSDGESLSPGLLVGIVKKVDGRNVYVQMVQDITNIDVVTVLEY